MTTRTKKLAIAGLIMLAGVSIIGLQVNQVMQANQEQQNLATEEVATVEEQTTEEQATAVLQGNWHGNYQVTAPEQCANVSGPVSLQLNQYEDGIVTGGAQFGSIPAQFEGKVTGSRVVLTVRNHLGTSRTTGTISGNNITGTFSGPICTVDTPATGTFSLSR